LVVRSVGGWDVEEKYCQVSSSKRATRDHEYAVLSKMDRTRGVSEGLSKWAGSPLFSAPVFVLGRWETEPQSVLAHRSEGDQGTETSRRAVFRQCQSRCYPSTSQDSVLPFAFPVLCMAR